MFKNWFKSPWTKWEKFGDTKYVKNVYAPFLDAIDGEWIEAPKTTYFLVQEYMRHNNKTGLDELMEQQLRSGSEAEYLEWKKENDYKRRSTI